jgi:LuxR family maltose regulon positive regulatory protein
MHWLPVPGWGVHGHRVYQLEVLDLIALGLSNHEIAERLFIAHGTVKRHINNIYAKLQVHRRTEAVARARELGLL